MEYIHKTKQNIISEEFYNTLSKTQKQDYEPYYYEGTNDGTQVGLNDLLGDDLDEDDMDFGDDTHDGYDVNEDTGLDDDFDFGGGSGGGAGASDDF